MVSSDKMKRCECTLQNPGEHITPPNRPEISGYASWRRLHGDGDQSK